MNLAVDTDARDLILAEHLPEGIVKLSLNSPPLNLMTVAMNQRLNQVLDEIGDDDQVRVVVITGSGERCFSAGAHIKEFAHFVKAGTMVSEKLELECLVMEKLTNLPQPTIAALNGITLGAGIELALCCDFRIAGETVNIGYPEIKLGLFPGGGGLVRLPRLVGATKAKELLFFGKELSAKEAKELGLVNEVLPNNQVVPLALQWAEELAKMPRQSLRAIKKGIQDLYEMPAAQGVRYSLGLISRVLATPDAQEGVAAFLEKREPKFNQSV